MTYAERPTTERSAPLDGLRALAAIAVLMFHVGPLVGGSRGVDVFFVLSGYLITGMLRRADLSYSEFLMRRLRRLVPALVAMICVSLPVMLLVRPDLSARLWRDAALALTYSLNIPRSFAVWRSPFIHTWSLAVEMQFYLLWPLIVPLLERARRPALWLLGSWAALTAIRFLPGLPSELPYYGLHQTGLLLGAAIAYLPAASARWGFLGAFLIVIDVASRLDNVLAEIGAALLISGLQGPSALQESLGWRPLAYVGKLSYGIYLWHLPVFYLLPHTAPWPLLVAMDLGVSILLAAISYHTLERAFRARARGSPVGVRFPVRPPTFPKHG